MGLYRALLRLYPTSFRTEYGEEMCAIFERRVRQASGLALIALWIDAPVEILFNALAAHTDILRQDLRYTVRTLLRSPGFTITAILVVALGVGANTAVFSVTDNIFLRALPYANPDRLVRIWESHEGYSRIELSPANYRDFKNAATSFESVGMFDSQQMSLVGQGDPTRVEAGEVSSEVLGMLGTQPVLGRSFTAADDRWGAPGTVVLGFPMWQSLFGGDPNILGRKMVLDDKPYTVIGVLPRDFHFPSRQIALWVPLPMPDNAYQDRDNNFLRCVAKLKPGVSLATALAEAKVIFGQLERQYPQENKDVRANLYLMRDDVGPQTRLLLGTLGGAALCELLIACTNLANLLLARALARRKELSVRMALGAGRERLVRQMITESLVLAALGGALGVAVAIAAVPLLARLTPTNLPISEVPPTDFRLLGFAALLTLITGAVFGLIPALRVSGRGDLSGLREGSRSGGGQKARLRSTLVIAEVMMSVVLLVSTGLLLRALWRVQGVDPGFRTGGLLTLRTALPLPKYEVTARRVQFYHSVLDDVRQIPGVTGAAYTSFLPMVMGGGIWPVSVDGVTLDRRENHTASARFISPQLFQTMGIPLKRGRDLQESDTLQRPLVIVVSESFVDRYWPGQDPIGRHITFGAGTPKDRIVVGVVGNIRVRGLEQQSEPQVYMPYTQVEDGWYGFYAPKDLVIHSALPPGALMPTVREIIRRADPQEPISDVRTMVDIVDAQTASRTLQVRVIAVFAGIAFLLAGVGIHGVLSFAVSQRTPEIGVRIALGARGADILAMILRQGAVLAAAGVLPGVLLAYAAGRSMQALLAGVQPGDLATFSSAAALSAAMALAGCMIPAMRAVRVDPLTAMRAE
jgi:predicted permease